MHQPVHSGPRAKISWLAFRGCWEGSLLIGAGRLALGAHIPFRPPYRVQSSLSAGITGPVAVDSQGERLMDYFVYALQKSGNGSLFLPFLQYDSHQKVIRPMRNFSTLPWPQGSLSEDRAGCVAALILMITLLITVLGAVIIGLILRMQRGKLQRQNTDIWWQINHDDITILSQHK
ncbi:hypothetical protein MC885_013623, partial [Smutsia gigantea]